MKLSFFIYLIVVSLITYALITPLYSMFSIFWMIGLFIAFLNSLFIAYKIKKIEIKKQLTTFELIFIGSTLSWIMIIFTIWVVTRKEEE